MNNQKSQKQENKPIPLKDGMRVGHQLILRRMAALKELEKR